MSKQPEFEIGTKRLETQWDNDTAEYVYVLFEYRGSVARIGGSHIDYDWSNIASGDLSWAKRQAQHYKIQIGGPAKKLEGL